MYGLKVVGGKISDNDKPGAFVTDVDEGSPADQAGLIPGDEIVEWNEQSLVDCTFEDVLDAISNSQESPDLHVVVSRPKYVFKAISNTIALSVLNCSSWRSSKDHLLLIQCYCRRKPKLN